MVEDSKEDIDISDQAHRSRLASLDLADASLGSLAEQQRFESSPKLSTDQSNNARSRKHLIEFAQTIMGECEIDVTDDAKEKLNLLATEQQHTKSDVMEQIIKIMAQSVKDQAEQVQVQPTSQARPMMEQTEQIDDHDLAQVESTQARQGVERITGIPLKDEANIGILKN